MKIYLYLAALCIAVVAAACTTSGKLATKANGPVDYTVTLNRVCTGLNGMDAVFKGLGSSGKISADDQAIEASAVKALNAFCDPTKPPLDLAGAVAAVAVASVDVGNIIAAASK